jgi:hypothetical protein
VVLTAVTGVVDAVSYVALGGQPVPQWERYTLVAALAVAMGVQNATARTLAVPDLTTTVLTLTLTGIAADSRAADPPGASSRLLRCSLPARSSPPTGSPPPALRTGSGRAEPPPRVPRRC